MKFDYFLSELTTQSIYFEIWLFLFSLLILIYWIKNYRFFLWRYFALFFWVFLFEILTSSLWLIEHLWILSYINGDVSIIMSILWTNMIVWARFGYDKLYKTSTLKTEYAFVVIVSTLLWLSLVSWLKIIWVFSYSKEMLQVVESWILIFGKPLEAIIYFPIFIFTVYSFYKYWELAMFDKKLFENYAISFGKDILIAIGVIIGLWYLLHPLLIVKNTMDYAYLILSFIIILILTNGIILLIKHMSLFIRFLFWSIFFTTASSIILNYFLVNHLVVLSESMKNTYTNKTIFIPGLQITDSEFAGLVILSYLIIAVVKYFKIVTDSKDIILDEKKMTFSWWKSLFMGK